MAQGTLIDYRLKLYGVPIKWRTEIETFEPESRFTDQQLSGPYALWHHQHHFKEVEGGVQMDDILHYKLKGGWLGDKLTGWLVHGRVQGIFDYRTNLLLKRFGGKDLS